MTGLRALDARLVPRAAAGLRALLARAATVPGPLRRLDDRLARRGPFAVLRESPQLGLAAVAALLVTGAGAVVALRTAPGQPSPPGRVLGPAVGASVPVYVDAARERAVAASRARPDASRLALVSLTAYLTPRQAAGLLADLEVQRVYLRVPTTPGSELLAADVAGLGDDLEVLYAGTARRKDDDRREALARARAARPTSPEQLRARDLDELAGRTAGREAIAYGRGCACVLAVVVRGPARTLAALPARRGVRVVEPAPGGLTLDQLSVRPLAPEQTTRAASLTPPRPGLGG
jgi:hypothetical protein